MDSSLIAPDFSWRRRLVAEDLRRLQDPVVLFEHRGTDSDGAEFWVYTVAGWLDGEPLKDGCTVGGEVIIVKADTREDADALASLGLHDTILALDAEEAAYQEAHAALARLGSVSPVERLEQAIKPDSDKSDAFVEDISKVRPLVGDDLVLAVGQVQ